MIASARSFTGSIPAIYDRHLGPVMFEPYAIELARRLAPGVEHVVEVAAGTGRTSRHLLDAMPATGRLDATDLNEAMLEQAANRVADPRVRWKIADAQALPFGDGRFDAVVCQFGLMFVPDRPLALREMRRVLRLGGRLLLDTWNDLDHNEATRILHELAFAALADDPPLFMRMPFSMFDLEALRELVAASGFTGIEIETVELSGRSESAEHLAIGFVRGNPLWNQLVERGADALAFERAVAAALSTRFGDHPCCIPLSAHIVTATA